MQRRSGLRWGAAAALILGCAVAAAQTTEERRRESSGGGGGYNAVIDNIDMLIDNYTRFLGRKYDLTGDQDEFTKKLIREKAYAFLDAHEEELRDLFDKMFQARTGGEMTQDDLMNWGKRVVPIFEHAKKIVIAGNEEWRDILNEQQKVIHDGDLKLMEESLQTTEEALSRIVSGEMTVEEFRHPTVGARRRQRPPQPTPPAEAEVAHAEGEAHADHEVKVAQEANGEVGDHKTANTVRPMVRTKPVGPGADTGAEGSNGAPPGGQPLPAEPEHPVNPDVPMQPEQEAPPPPPEQPQGEEHAPHEGQPQPPPEPPVAPPATKAPAPKPPEKNYESEWEKYVRDFIDKYKLDATQTQQAEQILKNSEAQADKYFSGKKAELEAIEKRENELKNVPARSPTVSGGDGPKANPGNRSAELAELSKKREALMAPIAKIFEDSLKPRLEKLPTRAQRKAAEEAARKPAGKTAKPADPKAGDKTTPAKKTSDSSGGKDTKP